MKALEEMKALLEVANLPPLQVWVTENLRWADIVPESDSDNTQRFARCADDDQAELFAHAPAYMAKLIAALEAVLNLANHEPRFRPRMHGGEYFPVNVSADEIIEVITEALA